MFVQITYSVYIWSKNISTLTARDGNKNTDIYIKEKDFLGSGYKLIFAPKTQNGIVVRAI